MPGSSAISVALALTLLLSPVHAEVQTHALFSEHAVLQQQMNVPVWGTAADGEQVTVEFQSQKMTTNAVAGRWQVVLKPLKPGGPFTLTIRGDQNTLTRTNILVGEVWVCSGQSNMGWGLGGSEKTNQIATHADLPQVRLFAVKQEPTAQPKRDFDERWEVCTPSSAYSFSAVGYYFGRDLHKAIAVPVGMIRATVGGSFAHTWMPARYLETDPVLRPLLSFWEECQEQYRQRLAQYQAREPELKKQYEAQLAKARAEGTPEPKPPQPPGDNPATDFRNMTAANYNGMIYPLQPYAIRGALWYQGENDAGQTDRYRTTLPTMIRAWRETWGEGNFPFLIVQLPAIGSTKPGALWARMRESQIFIARTVTNAASVVTLDCGNPQNPPDLHPPHKEPIGQRLVLTARALVYGQKIEYSGPIYEGMSVADGGITLSFTHVGGGLVAKGGGVLTGFTIAGADQKFAPATAQITGDKVIVSNPDVAAPVAVRYAWANYPVCNLFNQVGLPAAPFRTDDFR